MSNAVLSIADDALSTRIEDEVLVLATEGEDPRYIGLRGAGTRIWELIELGGHSRANIICQIVGEFEVEEAVAASDANSFINSLIERGIVREG